MSVGEACPRRSGPLGLARGTAQVLVGARLRGAGTTGEVAMWARFARTLGLAIAGAAVVVAAAL